MFHLGEQSVGKSYALNHLMDTSFAGSAMRCTEGVWLSATPTRNALIVAMDFEGTYIEFTFYACRLINYRSPFLGAKCTRGFVCHLIIYDPSLTPYKDALLVLFNVALSNLVNAFNFAFKPCLISNRSFSETTSRSGRATCA